MASGIDIPAIEAWDTENGEIVVWGTHDPVEAKVAFDHYEEVNQIDIDGENPPIYFDEADKYWGDPRLRHQEENWGKESWSSEPVKGWTPYLVWSA